MLNGMNSGCLKAELLAALLWALSCQLYFLFGITFNDYRITKCGKGEWEAKTLDDAKQMAIDFAEGVS